MEFQKESQKELEVVVTRPRSRDNYYILRRKKKREIKTPYGTKTELKIPSEITRYQHPRYYETERQSNNSQTAELFFDLSRTLANSCKHPQQSTPFHLDSP